MTKGFGVALQKSLQCADGGLQTALIPASNGKVVRFKVFQCTRTPSMLKEC